MSGGKEPVDPYGIPVFTGNLTVLDQQVRALAKDGARIATATGDIHSSFGGLQAFYKAPEADQLFATTKPVADRGAALKSDLATITGALGAYADDAQPLVAKLERLRQEASAFRDKADADDTWREDGDLIEENRRRHDEITEAWAAFQAVERTCYNKIIALVPGGKPLTLNDGSGGKHMHGWDPEALKQAKGLPWGDPVEESTRWYQVHEHAWDFVKGFAVDGVWATVKGLGTLVGTEGWDSMKQSWSGLADLSIGVSITLLTAGAGGTYLLTTPEEELPSWLRDSSRAMKETGKALIAYDQWSENPARAGGAVTFNALTTIFTGGTGGGVSGAGKAALAGKALSFANKASRIVDPTAYLFKGAGAGLTKISDVMAGLKGTGNLEIPPLPAGTVTLPDGAYKAADGTLTLPRGATVPDAAFEIPKGSVKLPDGAQIPTGAVDLGDGIVHLPEGMAPPAGSLPIQEGTLKLPEGTTALPEGTLRDFDANGNVTHLDRQGNILGEDGTLKQHHTDARRENPPTGAFTRTDADSPLPRTPAEQPALVGAGARGGSDTARLSSDPGDAGRVGNNLGRTGGDATNPNRPPGGTANNLPGGTAGNHLPTNSVDNGTPGGSPRGGQGDHIPANSLDGSNHTDAPTTSGGHSTDTKGTSGHGDGHEPPPLGGASEVRPDGARYVEEPTAEHTAAAEFYDRVRADPGSLDITRISENTGVSKGVLDRVRTHFFLTEHVVSDAPGSARTAYFTPRKDIADILEVASQRNLNPAEVVKFERFIAHEYIESHLMEAGMPYLREYPDAWDIFSNDGGKTVDYYHVWPRDAFHAGAHDLSLNEGAGGFGHWRSLGMDASQVEVAPQLANIDEVVAALKQELRSKGIDLK
ncbi:hypothetical protein ACIQPT_25565 [Streptomyces sp. NPDC091289]|uniref:hypothetical protein n=1 Tax=Streptomyces sp. NPDC091289 TaxID=3365989 RepID=UPI003823AA38